MCQINYEEAIMTMNGPAVMVEVERIRVDKAGGHDASTNQRRFDQVLY